MYTVALLAQKGGVGKTTLTISLAVLAERAGKRAGVIDADPQATASSWYLTRKNQGRELPVVAAAPEPDLLLQAVADAREDGFDWLFIDTPPGVSEVPATAAAAADLILVPCAPSMFNMEAMAPTAKLVRKVAKPAFFLINKGRSKGINDECALWLASNYGLPAVNTHISARIPISDLEPFGQVLPESTSKDESVAKGKKEFQALWAWVQKQEQGGAP
jgi:chromosome partitioning protein